MEPVTNVEIYVMPTARSPEDRFLFFLEGGLKVPYLAEDVVGYTVRNEQKGPNGAKWSVTKSKKLGRNVKLINPEGHIYEVWLKEGKSFHEFADGLAGILVESQGRTELAPGEICLDKPNVTVDYLNRGPVNDGPRLDGVRKVTDIDAAARRSIGR